MVAVSALPMNANPKTAATMPHSMQPMTTTMIAAIQQPRPFFLGLSAETGASGAGEAVWA